MARDSCREWHCFTYQSLSPLSLWQVEAKKAESRGASSGKAGGINAQQQQMSAQYHQANGMCVCVCVCVRLCVPTIVFLAAVTPYLAGVKVRHRAKGMHVFTGWSRDPQRPGSSPQNRPTHKVIHNGLVVGLAKSMHA